MSEGAVDSGQASLPGTSEPAAPQAIAPEPVSTVTPTTWRDGLSDDLRAHPSLADFKDVGGLAQSYVKQSELVGRKGVLLPAENDPADQARYYNELGRPESVDGYDLGDFEPPTEIGWSQDVQTSVMAAMHESGLTNTQVNNIVRAYSASQHTELEGIAQGVTQQHEAGITELKQEWGVNYDANVDRANRAFDLATGDKKDEIRLMVLADGSTFGNNPAMIRIFANMGEKLGEDSLRGDGATQSFTKSPQQALDELSTMAIDKDFDKVLHDRNHPEHERAVARKNALYEMAYPNTEKTE